MLIILWRRSNIEILIITYIPENCPISTIIIHWIVCKFNFLVFQACRIIINKYAISLKLHGTIFQTHRTASTLFRKAVCSVCRKISCIGYRRFRNVNINRECLCLPIFEFKNQLCTGLTFDLFKISCLNCDILTIYSIIRSPFQYLWSIFNRT